MIIWLKRDWTENDVDIQKSKTIQPIMRGQRMKREGTGEQRYKIKKSKSQKVTLKEINNENEPEIVVKDLDEYLRKTGKMIKLVSMKNYAYIFQGEDYTFSTSKKSKPKKKRDRSELDSYDLTNYQNRYITNI